MSVRFHRQQLVNGRDRTYNSGFSNLTKTLVPQIYLWRQPKDVYCDHNADFSCIDYLVKLLHESATLTSVRLKNNGISKTYPKLAKAWIGTDPDAWHGYISYQAAVYSLLKAVLAIEEALDDKHVVDDILSNNVQLVFQSIEYNMNKHGAAFVEWFTREELPALTKSLTLVLESHASTFNKSYKAVTTLAITCCVAIEKLNPARIACPFFTASLPDIIWKLVESSPDFSSIEIGHHKATELGVEHEFLTFFGTKILHYEARGNVLFWMGLLQEKLIAALHREKVITIFQHFYCSKVSAEDLAIIGLFAFLGRKTRLFIEQMGIVDLDDPLNDFICYLECGIIFLYPELCCVCAYQLFMDYGCSDKILETHPEATETKPHWSFFAKSRSSLLASVSDLYMGTQLLFVDLKLAAWLVQKRLFGQVLTKRERKKIARTAIDFVCVIPIVILMLLPVTAIGHAAMLTAIKRYIPDLIPSPYSPQKLQVIKQLKKAKKMKVGSCNNPNAVSLAF